MPSKTVAAEEAFELGTARLRAPHARCDRRHHGVDGSDAQSAAELAIRDRSESIGLAHLEHAAAIAA